MKKSKKTTQDRLTEKLAEDRELEGTLRDLEEQTNAELLSEQLEELQADKLKSAVPDGL